MNGELLRLIDALHREKDINKEILFEAIEGAIGSAIHKRHDPEGELVVKVDRLSGQIEIFLDDEPKAYPDMGRIQAQTAKQVIIQKIREAERDVVYAEYETKVGSIINGNVQRIEGGNVIVNLGRAEGFLPKHEKIRGENYQPGDRIKALIYEVRKVGQKVKIMLTRASPKLVIKLFELEVPEIGEKIIEVKRIAREPGYRTKIAVSSYDMRVDCIGACVGIRGSRIKSITDELNDEKIDIIRWNESAEVLIINSLKPAQISSMILDEKNKIATVLVPDDMLSLAIGRKGQNVRLATKLTGWDIKIQASTEEMEQKASSKDEDPELADARKALFEGTSFEKKLAPVNAKSVPETKEKDEDNQKAEDTEDPEKPEDATDEPVDELEIPEVETEKPEEEPVEKEEESELVESEHEEEQASLSTEIEEDEAENTDQDDSIKTEPQVSDETLNGESEKNDDNHQ